MKLSENSLLVKTLKGIAGTKTKGEAAYTEAELYYRGVGVECAVFGPGNPDLSIQQMNT